MNDLREHKSQASCVQLPLPRAMIPQTMQEIGAEWQSGWGAMLSGGGGGGQDHFKGPLLLQTGVLLPIRNKMQLGFGKDDNKATSVCSVLSDGRETQDHYIGYSTEAITQTI